MLKQNSFFAVSEVARLLAERKVVVAPKDNMPLMPLVDASLPDFVIDGVSSEDGSAEFIAGSGRKNLAGDVEHDDALEEYAGLIGTAISSSIDVARNQVNPTIRDMVRAIDDAVSNATLAAPRHQVVTLFRPKIMKNMMLEEMTDKYSNSLLDNVHFRTGMWPILENEFLLNSLKTGIKRIDTDVEKWVSDLGDDALLLAYNAVFRNQDYAEEVDPLMVHVMSFLWARTWVDNVPENVNGELTQVRNLLTRLKASSGRAISNDRNLFERTLKSGNFIKQWNAPNQKGRPIIVYGETFNEWLKAGGTPEALIGACLRGERPGVTVNEAAITKWQKAYEGEERAIARNLTAKREAIVARAIADFVHKDISELETRGDREEARKDFKEFVERRPYRTGREVDNYCREVICNIYFPGTNALEILEIMDETMRQNPDIDAREAATIATIEVLSDWLVSLLDVQVQR